MNPVRSTSQGAEVVTCCCVLQGSFKETTEGKVPWAATGRTTDVQQLPMVILFLKGLSL